MVARARETDVVVIGLGGMGGIAAHVLTRAGIRVVGLEAGPHRPASQMTFDEIRNDVREWMAEPKARHEVPTWRERESDVAGPSPWPMLMANGVGGATVHYECVSLRFHPWDFRPLSNIVERYGAAAIPEGATPADWPLDYDDLAPYYDATERALGVSGLAGRVRDSVQPGGDIFEAPRTRDYPMRPLRRSGWNELMQTAAEELGWHPFPAPAAINSEPRDGRGECTFCGFCRCNGCHVDAKGSTATTVIPRAEQTGLLAIETDARVVAIEVGADGLAAGVRYVQGGVERFQSARVVLLATFTYENTRLLLLSRSAAFPNGIANNGGQVGRNYMAHINAYAFGLFAGRNLNLFNGTMAQGVCVNDWNADHFDHTGLGFVGGGMLSAWGELKPIGVAAGRAVPPGVPRWGGAWKRWLAAHARSVGGASSQFDSLPYETNHLDLDPVVRDPHGLPVVRVTHRVHENERRGGEFHAEKLQQWLRRAGATETWAVTDQVEGRHAYGGTRMGHDPQTSVVDAFGMAHEVPNLGVLGASVFPSAGGYNPTLTAQALSWRTAEHIVGNWGSVRER
ncbi:GMC family oxidoreductase [Pseudonocardia sp.]|uniref:GMC family oxidoreductase n=1 Tax=Pseudonocardia sp. TaxID=60912 RepID=UPI003D120888